MSFAYTINDRPDHRRGVPPNHPEQQITGIEGSPHLNLHESDQWHVKLKHKYVVQLQLHVGIVP
ncbi:MAG: hypothetical protein ACRDSF_01560 [Pseudonocardiaceae bacterium]